MSAEFSELGRVASLRQQRTSGPKQVLADFDQPAGLECDHGLAESARRNDAANDLLSWTRRDHADSLRWDLEQRGERDPHLPGYRGCFVSCLAAAGGSNGSSSFMSDG